jgi:RimJ/RimL family protein N-acetyltransferase
MESERLILRNLTDEDFDAVHAYASDPKVCTYMEWGPNTPEETRAHLARCIAEVTNPRPSWTMALVQKSDQRLIGSCSLTIDVGVTPGAASMGYVIHRELWGHGYATEAGKTMLAFGFNTLGLHRIWATCRPENTASAKVLQKIGMQYEAHLPRDKAFRGQWHDSLLFAAINHSLPHP